MIVEETFTIKPTPKIVFGAGRFTELPELISGYGLRPLVLTGERSLRERPEWAEMEGACVDLGMTITVETIRGEPSPEIIDRITAGCRGRNIDVVVGIGGGSVLDAGKAVSAMLTCEGSVKEYLEGVGTRKPPGIKLPCIAVPTTAGTGSETTSNAVLSRTGTDGFKKSLRHDNYIPEVALVDPMLTLDMPRSLTIHCGMDAFTQLVESYLSSRSTPYTDALARGALKRLGKALIPLCQDEGGLEERSVMSYSACISGITLANAGLGVIHGFASVLGGLFDIPHGVVCGTLMAACNSATLAKLRRTSPQSVALQKYAELGRLFSDANDKADNYYQDSFIDTLEWMTKEWSIDRLGKYGISRDDISTVAEKTGCKNNPVQLERKELEAILVSRL